MIYQLNLPQPSQQLLGLVEKFVEETTLNPDNKRWLDEFHNSTINSSQHLFALAPTLTDQLRVEYSRFFTTSIHAVVGIMKNSNSTQLACQPPHIDRGRTLAINYYIELGGNNVSTWYYNTVNHVKSNTSQNYLYTEVDPVGQYIFEKNKWYAYEVSRCHSVEDIETTRYFLSIAVSDSPETYTLHELTANTTITFDKCKLIPYNKKA
jgi:hypothetical protein